MDKVQCYTFFPSQDIKHNVLLSFYLESWDVINFKIHLGSSSKAMPDREREKEGEMKIPKFQARKGLFRWDKKRLS